MTDPIPRLLLAGAAAHRAGNAELADRCREIATTAAEARAAINERYQRMVEMGIFDEDLGDEDGRNSTNT